MFEEHRTFESPDFERPSFEIQSEKVSAYSNAEKLLIARVVYAESRGEIFEGQVAVATVVLNRYESGSFGSSIAKIVFAHDQFAITEKYNSESLKAVERAISKLGTYPRNMYYFQVSKSRVWRNFVYYKRIGNHSFYLSGK
jgi:N-acetylmuramoyl-L-alanine amidase